MLKNLDTELNRDQISMFSDFLYLPEFIASYIGFPSSGVTETCLRCSHLHTSKDPIIPDRTATLWQRWQWEMLETWLQNVTMWENHLQISHFHPRYQWVVFLVLFFVHLCPMVMPHFLHRKSSIRCPWHPSGVPDWPPRSHRSCTSCQARAIKNQPMSRATWRFGTLHIPTWQPLEPHEWRESSLCHSFHFRFPNQHLFLYSYSVFKAWTWETDHIF